MASGCRPWRHRAKLQSFSSASCHTPWRWEWSRPGQNSSRKFWQPSARRAMEAQPIRLPGTVAVLLLLHPWRLLPLSGVRFPAPFPRRPLRRDRPLAAAAADSRADLPVAEVAVEEAEDGDGYPFLIFEF